MSYSFQVTGATKAEALDKVAEALHATVVAQSVHAADAVQAQAAADAFVGILADDDARDVGVSMNGSLWQSDQGVQQASVTVAASLVARK
jgi:hypothetical protein